MIKKTILVSSPASLRVRRKQLHINQQDNDPASLPIEDIGYLILDDPAIQITQPVLGELLGNQVAVIVTDKQHMPLGLFLNLAANSTQLETTYLQVEAPQPLRKRLWQQTIQAKLKNQAKVLEHIDQPSERLKKLTSQVKSGDSTHCESQGARYYWAHVFPDIAFKRERFGAPPNNLLNYGYAILRAIIARAITSSGLLPIFSLNHHNKYNDFPLADDLMEPYRPVVDHLVLQMMAEGDSCQSLTPEVKRKFLALPQLDVIVDKEHKPLMLAASRTTASLAACFKGERKHLVYPGLCL